MATGNASSRSLSRRSLSRERWLGARTKRRQPSGAARLAGFLLLLCAGLALGRAASAASARDLGTLGPFYRATQLQGHLIGMGLIETPAYLTASDIDLKYRARSGTSREIPFADSFTIKRFLGGYRDDWLQKFHEWDDRLGRRSLDYAIRRSDGSWQFRPELVRGRNGKKPRHRQQPSVSVGF